jgi:cell division protein FtsQ
LQKSPKRFLQKFDNLNKLVKILVWLAIAAYVVVAAVGALKKRSDITVGTMHIVIADTTRVVTAEKVTRWLSAVHMDPIGANIDSVDVGAIELALAAQPEVKHASAWTDLDGTLTVRVEPRTPILRVRTAGGYRFWFSDDGVIMPDMGDYPARVSVVTGSVAWPFTPSTTGSYADIVTTNRADFRAQFVALAEERRALENRMTQTRNDIRSVRNSAPGRLRSRSYKMLFAERKAARLKELEAARAEIAPKLAALSHREAELKEKEKKSHESHRFLPKLANIVRFIERDDFWASQIVQINVVGGSANAEHGEHGEHGDHGSDMGRRPERWREPQLELIPRAGDHIILLGGLDGEEAARLDNLRIFYEKGMWREGWDKYTYINIKYGNQIVCTN